MQYILSFRTPIARPQRLPGTRLQRPHFSSEASPPQGLTQSPGLPWDHLAGTEVRAAGLRATSSFLPRPTEERRPRGGRATGESAFWAHIGLLGGDGG
jgi:hypothetical protein